MSSDDYILSSLDFRSDVLIEIRDDTLDGNLQRFGGRKIFDRNVFVHLLISRITLIGLL